MARTAPLRRRATPPVDMREQIVLRAAASAFGTSSYHAVTMEGVARRAGLAKPSVYELFRSKDELYDAVIAAECKQLTDHLFATYGRVVGMPIRERIRASTAAFLEYAEENPHGFRLLFTSDDGALARAGSPVDAMLRQITYHVAGMIRHDMKSHGTVPGRSADLIASMVVTMIVYTARRWTTTREWDVEPMIELMTSFQLGGYFGVSKEECAAADREPAPREIDVR